MCYTGMNNSNEKYFWLANIFVSWENEIENNLEVGKLFLHRKEYLLGYKVAVLDKNCSCFKTNHEAHKEFLSGRK